MEGIMNSKKTDEKLTDKCSKHDGKTIKFLCGAHKILCCDECILSKHNNCKDCISLTAIFQENGSKKLLIETAHEIDKLKVEFEKHTLTKSADRQRLDVEFELSKKRAAEYRYNLDKELDRLQKQFERDLEYRHGRDTKAIDKDIETSKEMTAKLYSALKATHDEENNNDIKSLIRVLTTKEMTEKFQVKLKNLSDNTWKKNLLYRTDPQLENTLKSMKSFGTFENGEVQNSAEESVPDDLVDALGALNSDDDEKVQDTNKVRPEAQKDSGNPIHSTKHMEGKNNNHKTELKLSSVAENNKSESAEENAAKEKGTTVTAEQRVYKQAGILEGMTLSENGQLIIADSFNKTLQISHVKELKNIQTIRLNSAPRDICIINETAFGISFKQSHEVHLATLNEGRLKTIHTINIGKVCFGIFYKNGKLYVTCGHGNGSELRLYFIDQSLTYVRFCCKFPGGKSNFVSPCCVYTDRDVSTIYVGDYSEGVKALHKDGTQVWINDGRKILKGVWDMAVDENDDIYVTGHRTNNVVKISSDGVLCGSIINDLERPTAISYDFMTRTLLIVYDTNQLLVYKVKN